MTNSEPVIVERGYLEEEQAWWDRRNDVAKRFNDQFVVDPVATKKLEERLDAVIGEIDSVADEWRRVGNGLQFSAARLQSAQYALRDVIEQMRERVGCKTA